MSVEIERVVINHVSKNPGSSIKTIALVDVFHKAAGGNVMTVEKRLSRLMASLYREGRLNRKKVPLGIGHDGTPWVYGYDVNDL